MQKVIKHSKCSWKKKKKKKLAIAAKKEKNKKTVFSLADNELLYRKEKEKRDLYVFLVL